MSATVDVSCSFPPGPRTVIIVRPRALAWDLLVLRADASAIREVDPREAENIVQALADLLETVASGELGHTEVQPTGEGFVLRADLGSFRLLAWDLVGTALASVDWDVLVALLAGETTVNGDLFTWSLYRCILNDSHLQQLIKALMHHSSDVYACADALKEWFRMQVDAWIDLPAIRLRKTAERTIPNDRRATGQLGAIGKRLCQDGVEEIKNASERAHATCSRRKIVWCPWCSGSCTAGCEPEGGGSTPLGHPLRK